MKKTVEILIAEDSPTQAFKTQCFLEERKHYSVSVVHTGKEAIEQLKIRKPSVIISDIVMPEMDGYELCRFVKNDDAFKDIPVILLTGLSDPVDIVSGLAAGAEDYILKPYDNEDLINKIELLLANPIKKVENKEQEEMAISFGGKQYSISANRRQIMHLLISTYENVILQNKELINTQSKLEDVNRTLDNRLRDLEISQTDLKQSEERFRILVQMIPDLVYRIDEQGRFTFINNAVQQLGYLPSELIGKHFSCIMSTEDAEKVTRSELLKELEGKQTGLEDQPKLFDERRTGERITKGLEINLIPKGQNKTISGVMGPIGDEIVIVEINSSGMYGNTKDTKESEFIGTVGVVRDITERKLAQNAISQLNKQLEQKVNERTKALYKSKEDLEKTLEDLNITQQQVIQSEKLASIGTVIAGVTHELNNPLMGVINYVQFVCEKIDDKKLQGYLRKAETEAKRCSKIVGDLLSYARTTKPDMDNVNCKDVIDNAVSLLDLDFRTKTIDVTVDIPRTLPAVLAKQESLQQVLLNLLINARDAMANCTAKQVHIECAQVKDNVQISVQDTGHGMSTETIRRIFDPFFTTKEPGKGTGLGLSVSTNIITSFEGTLTCQSDEGKGTTFIITLPIAKKEG
ncbi:MAG: ATP-binding protein [Candidatus Anammoxibacter sp.]